MQVVISLQDNEGVQHRNASISPNEQVTIDELKKELVDIFHIKSYFQHILFGDMAIDILFGPLTQIGTGNRLELVLKHSQLGNWVSFKGCLTDIERYPSDKEYIRWASEILTLLDKSDFFLAYPRFTETYRYFNNTYAHKLDKDEEHIKAAAQVYFLNLFKYNPNNPNVDVAFEKKKVEGVQGGLICVVTITKIDKSKAIKKYHVKILSGISSRASGFIDIREIFVYKLLEKMKIGPKVYFIPHIHKSKFGMYIATEDVYGFEMHSEKPLTAEQMSKLNFLEYILMLGDLSTNEMNFGSDDQGNLIIVDFKIGFHVTNYLSEDLREKNAEEYANYLKSWTSIFDDVNNEIKEQKQFLERNSIWRKEIRRLEIYIDEIKERCNQIYGKI